MRNRVAAMLVLTLAACGGAPDSKDTSFRTGGGTLALDHAMPKLPTYVPAYPGATLVDSVVATPNGAQKGGGVLDLTTGDAPAAVMAFYQHSAAAAGLRQTSRSDQDGDLLAAFGRPGASQSFSVDAQPGEGGRGAKITLAY